MTHFSHLKKGGIPPGMGINQLDYKVFKGGIGNLLNFGSAYVAVRKKRALIRGNKYKVML